ncbi:hypothetical protein H4582DRAFT_1972585 [Lactarius indigo]|nr:hypothetical protein H4582DRAFT_1972585 [Lactarius indigo]
MHHTTISALNNDVLLNIFHWYRLGNTTDEFDRGWNLERWWYNPIQVCRAWRHLILTSPTRLDLHLVCTHGTPVTTMLTHSPPLPLIIYYPGKLAAGEDEDVIFALQHRERVRRIHIGPPVASLPGLLDAMDGEYPDLQRLVVHSHTEKPNAASNTSVELPTNLQAPLLRRLTLTNVRLPASSELLRRAEGLITLELLDIADSPELHPAHLVAQLARMTQLERLVVHFRSALPNHAVERTLWRAPTTSATLPRLQLLSFRGGSAYLEGVLARISAPGVQKLFVDFFAQLTFDLPSLVRFVRAAQPAPEEGGGARSRFYAAELHFDAETACVLLDSRTTDRPRLGGVRTNPVQLRVSCRALDWQLAALAQICGALAPLFVHVEGLTLGLHTSHPKPDANPDCLDSESDRAQWHALLHAFSGTKTLQLTGTQTAHLLHELLPLPAELLPALQELLPGDSREPGATEDNEGGLAAFTAEREATGRPVRVVRDWW